MYSSALLLGLLLQAKTEPLPASPFISASTGGIRAEIRDPRGALVPGVRVLLKAPAGRAWVTFSNAKGQFKAGDLPPGDYQLELHKESYQSQIYPRIRIKGDAWLLGVSPGPPELLGAGGPRLHVAGPATYEFRSGVIAPYTRPETEKIPMH
jgi:hypothetical protein